jgi:hypothetical protein
MKMAGLLSHSHILEDGCLITQPKRAGNLTVVSTVMKRKIAWVVIKQFALILKTGIGILHLRINRFA